MIPFGNKTVTLFHKAGNGYERHTLTGCSWKSTDVRTLSGSSIVVTTETTCRIPAGQLMPDTGDLIALGTVDGAAANEIELVRLMQNLRNGGAEVFRVLRVKNNALGVPMPHYAASGE